MDESTHVTLKEQVGAGQVDKPSSEIGEGGIVSEEQSPQCRGIQDEHLAREREEAGVGNRRKGEGREGSPPGVWPSRCWPSKSRSPSPAPRSRSETTALAPTKRKKIDIRKLRWNGSMALRLSGENLAGVGSFCHRKTTPDFFKSELAL
jgi:hypothetical protein